MPEAPGHSRRLSAPAASCDTKVKIVRAILPKPHVATVYAKPPGRPFVDSFITEVSRLIGETVDLTAEERATHDALTAEYDRLQEKFADADELPDEADQRLGEIETALAALDERPVVYHPAEVARAGVFVSIGSDGELHIKRRYARPEDEPQIEGGETGVPAAGEPNGGVQGAVITVGGGHGSSQTEAEDDDALKPLSERLFTELTTHRTLALRDALANNAAMVGGAVSNQQDILPDKLSRQGIEEGLEAGRGGMIGWTRVRHLSNKLDATP